jgi:hypothetical protein
MSRSFLEYFRCPSTYADFAVNANPTPPAGFFRFGQELVCYGKLTSGAVQKNPADSLQDVCDAARAEGNRCFLPFDLDEIVDNLRYERYCSDSRSAARQSMNRSIKRKAYYLMRPFLPTAVRKHLQRLALRGWHRAQFPSWPVDQTVDRVFDEVMALVLRANPGERIPFIWFWPDGLPGCAIVTHDVETAVGRDFCNFLMDLDDSFSIKSSFQLVPEVRYDIPDEFLNTLRERGFEINVHDYNHDGELFCDREQFLQRVARINASGKKFQARGYRSGVLYRNIDWYDNFEYAYDMSVPNVGHLDPQPGGCCTTKPFFIGRMLEIPVVATQDYTLFNILGRYSTDLWEQQIECVLRQNGLISFIVHPDYLIEKRARKVYSDLLSRLAQLRREFKLWIALPREVNDWWRNRREMRLVKHGDSWQIEGPGKEHARIAYASLKGDRVIYTVEAKRELQPTTPVSIPVSDSLASASRG